MRLCSHQGYANNNCKSTENENFLFRFLVKKFKRIFQRSVSFPEIPWTNDTQNGAGSKALTSNWLSVFHSKIFLIIMIFCFYYNW